MKPTQTKAGCVLIVLLIFLLALAFPSVRLSLAEGMADGPEYTIEWWTVDGGGIVGQGGVPYSLSGTVGQADAGVLAGGAYTLAGGFWHGGATFGQYIYLPLVLKN